MEPSAEVGCVLDEELQNGCRANPTSSVLVTGKSYILRQAHTAARSQTREIYQLRNQHEIESGTKSLTNYYVCP